MNVDSDARIHVAPMELQMRILFGYYKHARTYGADISILLTLMWPVISWWSIDFDIVPTGTACL